VVQEDNQLVALLPKFPLLPSHQDSSSMHIGIRPAPRPELMDAAAKLRQNFNSSGRASLQQRSPRWRF